MSIKYLILDLDNTLYPKSSGMLQHIDDRIDQYLAATTAIQVEDIGRIRQEYWCKYGTTIGGMVARHGTDPADYFGYAYGIEVRDFIGPDPELARMLRRLDLQKVVFSNSPAEYVGQVLEVLEIRDQIEAVYDIGFCQYLGKPNPSSYRKVLADLGAAPEECLFVDDTAVNVAAAGREGLAAVWLGPAPMDGVEWRIERIHDLEELLPLVLRTKRTA